MKSHDSSLLTIIQYNYNILRKEWRAFSRVVNDYYGKRVAVILLILPILAGCGNQPDKTASDEITVQEWLDSKGGTESSTMTVTVTSIVNPVLAIVEDEFGTSVNLYGVMVEGEFTEFEKAGISQGDTIVIRGGEYNEYEGNVEIAEATLVEIKQEKKT